MLKEEKVWRLLGGGGGGEKILLTGNVSCWWCAHSCQTFWGHWCKTLASLPSALLSAFPATEKSRLWVKRQPCSCNRETRLLNQLAQVCHLSCKVCPRLSLILQRLPKPITYTAKFGQVYHLFCKVCPSLSLILQSLPKSITYPAKSAKVFFFLFTSSSSFFSMLLYLDQ